MVHCSTSCYLLIVLRLFLWPLFNEHSHLSPFIWSPLTVVLPVCALRVLSLLGFDGVFCLCICSCCARKQLTPDKFSQSLVCQHAHSVVLIVSLLLFWASNLHPDLTVTLCARSLRLFRPPLVTLPNSVPICSSLLPSFGSLPMAFICCSRKVMAY